MFHQHPFEEFQVPILALDFQKSCAKTWSKAFRRHRVSTRIGLSCWFPLYQEIKVGANRPTCQLTSMSGFFLVTNMLGKKKILKKCWPTFIEFLINVGQHWRQKLVKFTCWYGLQCLPTCWPTFLTKIYGFKHSIRIFREFEFQIECFN